jgi:acetylornithine deacetylase/succinyl-diaminopimelate desuccinylase-like protein
MSMGSMVFTITLTAPNGGQHTRYIPFGENLIRHLGDLIGRVTAFQQELDATTRHPLAGAERIDVGIAEAGDYFNRTPRVARLVGTRRWSVGKDAAGVLAELRRLVAPVAEAGGLEANVLMEHEREPFDTPTDDPAVVAAARAHERVTGRPVEYVGERIVGDANLYVHGTGVPTFYYGPSNETAHADVEWVSVERAANAARVYALTALAYCGVVDE